jgi:putative flippase GtrA
VLLGPEVKKMKQIAKFAGVGVLNTAVDFLCFLVLFRWLSIDPVVSNVAAFLVAASHGYLLNHFWTFRGTRTGSPNWQGWLTYIFVNAAGALFTTTCIYMFSNHMSAIGIKLISTVVVFVWGYFASSRWIFRKNS